jgi:hypothetical protein
METEFFVEALSSDLVSLVNIDNLPSLVGIVFVVSISRSNNECLTFFILFVFNFKDLVVSWVNEEFSIELEDLEPS